VKEAAKRAGNEAAKLAKEAGRDVEEARKRASEPFQGFRSHDLRHQAITEMSEAGAPDATIMAVAGHLDRAMMEHYSHVRMAAKRDVLGKLESGLMEIPIVEAKPKVEKLNGENSKGYVTIYVTKRLLRSAFVSYVIEKFGRGEWIRTTDLLVPNNERKKNQ